MPVSASAEQRPNRSWFDEAETLHRPERILLVVVLLGFISADIVGTVTTPDVTPLQGALSFATTLTFVLYLWSPLIATIALGAAIGLSFVGGDAIGPLAAGSIAALLVLRLGTTRLVAAYAGGLLLYISLFASGFGTGGDTQTNVTIYLLLATITGAVGLALRLATARRRRLEEELKEELATRSQHEREAVLAERRAIAGELHDSIAHHLTIVALHSQLLDDDAMREASQDAIRVATRKALSDLRFVIEMAEDTPKDSDAHSNRLAEAIDEALTEIEAAGHSTICDGDPHDERIPRGVEIILTRIIRESATNILKHAGPGEVRIALGVASDSVGLTISSPLPTTPRRDLPSTGTGLNRMAERVLGVRGEFEGGPQGDQWFISVRLPIAPTLASRATPAENELESS